MALRRGNKMLKPNYRNVLRVLTFFLMLNTSTALANYKTTSGKIDFYAIGKPSMLKIHGIANALEGTMNLLGDEISGKFKVKMNDFSSGLSLRDSHTRSKVFEVEKFPEAEFIMMPIKVSSGEKTNFKGLLKFHGVEKEIQGELIPEFKGEKLSYHSNFNIMLADFKIQPPEFAGMKINEEVRIEVSGEAVK